MSNSNSKDQTATSSHAFIKPVLCVVLWLAFVYSCIAFLCWQGNPAKWSWDARYFMMSFGFIVGMIIGVASYAMSKADKQNARVLDIFASARYRSFAAHEIWQHYKTKYNEPNTPLTSIRRSITTLEKKGELQMTGETVMGLYGVLVNKWKVR